MATSGWFADPAGRHQVRYFDGTSWTDQVADNRVISVEPLHGSPARGVSPVPVAPPPPTALAVSNAGPTYRGPARTAHGPLYWLLVGWWWGPAKWMGRVLLWLVLWPVG